MILMSRSEEIILLAVRKLAGRAYGVPIRDQIKADIGRHWSFGVIYKTLKKLRQKGYVHKISGAPLAERGGRCRFYYEISSAGLDALEEIRRVHVSIWNGIPAPTVGKKTR